MSDQIEPVLTPEEWAMLRSENPRAAILYLAYGPSTLAGAEAEPNRKALGALALLGYFTWEDVDALTRIIDCVHTYSADAAFMSTLRAKLEALLPPRPGPTP